MQLCGADSKTIGHGTIARPRTGASMHLWQVPIVRAGTVLWCHAKACLVDADGILYICSSEAAAVELVAWTKCEFDLATEPVQAVLLWEKEMKVEGEVARAFAQLFDDVEHRFCSLKRRLSRDLAQLSVELGLEQDNHHHHGKAGEEAARETVVFDAGDFHDVHAQAH